VKKLLLSIVLIIYITPVFWSQQRFFTSADSLNKKRFTFVSVGLGTTWAGGMTGLHEIWYKNVEKSSFHTFNDGSNWLQMDKMGHFYTNYHLAMNASELYQWTGLSRNKSIALGSSIGFGFQTTLELFDGFSTDWGFSWYDMLGNTLGTGAYAIQEIAWKEQRILPKFSYSPSPFADLRPEVLGSNFTEQLLKDYNGQTYWLSINPSTFFKNSKLPKWACISVGYSANAKIKGDADSFIAPDGTSYFAQREWLLSLDIDLSRIPVKRPWVKMVLKQFNALKIPFPALILSNGKISGRPFYF
jgi:uncharacterized protein YfiM (DUF2279 family)